MGPSSRLSCETGHFSCCHNPHRILQVEVLRHYFPMLESWVAWSVSLPSCSPQFICTRMSDHLVHQLMLCHMSSLLRLPVSTPSTSLDECFLFSPWLLDFHMVWFSDSSGCFLFSNLLLSFFWLCEEVKYICLCLQFGWKSSKVSFLLINQEYVYKLSYDVVYPSGLWCVCSGANGPWTSFCLSKSCLGGC